MDINVFDGWHSPMGVFSFVILIVLIGSLFSWLKVRAQQETIREAIKAGIKLEPDMLKDLESGSGNSRRGLIIAGFVLVAVSVALVFFGYMLKQADGDGEVLLIFTGIAGFPGLIGVALLIASLFAGGKSDLKE